MMTDVNVVTSCSAEGWEQYGREFARTFKQYWPSSVKLYVVSEDPIIGQTDGGIEYWRLQAFSKGAKYFLDTHNLEGWTQGASASERPAGIAKNWRERQGYNFRYDAYKFCKKVFAIEVIANHLKRGRLFWIDADTLTFDHMPSEFFDRVLPAKSALSCLERPGYHSECGFVGYNLDHSETLRFIKAFAELYASGEVFKLAEWHDSWVFDYLRNKMMVNTHRIPHKSVGHPFINSELGRYMDHLKGRRKEKGRTPAREQVSPKNRALPYWSGQ